MTAASVMTPETRLLAALDGFRDALADYIAEQRPEPVLDRAVLTLAETARRLGVARSTVSRWADTGAVATLALDGRRWVSAAELDRVAGSRAAEPALEASTGALGGRRATVGRGTD